MKKSRIIICLLVLSLIVGGCGSNNKVISNGKTVDTSKMVHEHCVRGATAGEGIDVSLSYDLYYTGDILNIVSSEEKVISTNQDSLTLYEDAYRKINENYVGIEYYDMDLTRGDDYVSSVVTINYDKVDIPLLISIEGEENNVFENGQAKVSKWKELADKVGTKCEVVED